MHPASARDGATRSTTAPTVKVATSAAAVCGRKLAAAAVIDSPRSPSRLIWWKATAVASIPLTDTAAATSQNQPVRAACARVMPTITCLASPPSGTPSGRCPSCSGRSLITSSASGITVSQTRTPSPAHTARQPYAETSRSRSTGARLMPAAPTADTTPTATPRRRVNHSAVAVVAVRPSAPCPAIRIPTKPAVTPTIPVTADNPMRKAPNTAPTTAMVRRTPNLSSARPTIGMAAAPVSVPIR
jgi:hypothetical protein